MGCGCFTAHITTATATEPDPTRHVNYQLGMVLGVDDFNQEFAYLAGRDQWLARDLIGYGTVRGLRARYENDGAKGPRVVVDAGSALSPSGKLICVPAAQCASLKDWLAANAKAVSDRLGSQTSATLKLYVTLCYRDCPTDDVPIPGEPCRSEDELKAPSRIADDFCLEMRLDPPEQREEDAVRDFVSWLRRIEISNAVISSSPLDQFLQAIRAAALPWLSPPSSPLSSPPGDFMFGSPPGGLQIRPQDACQYLSAAFQLWVTELRPKWYGRWHGCTADMKDNSAAQSEDCVLLGQVDVPALLNSPGSWEVSDVTNVQVKIEHSPYIVHLRMLQEWLLCNLMNADPTHGTPTLPNLSGDVSGPMVNNAVTRLLNVNLDAALPVPTTDQVLTVVNIGGVPHWRAANLPATMALNGDVSGAISNNVVTRIRGVAVASIAPSPGQVLTAVQVGSNQVGSNPGDPTIIWRPMDPGAFLRAESSTASGPNDYAIVAAGLVRTDGTAIGIVYNDLTAKVTPQNEVLVSFTGYKQPKKTNPQHQYIVKALPAFNKAVQVPTVVFRSFQPQGIILRVTDAGSIPKDINRLELMIEISQYFVKA